MGDRDTTPVDRKAPKSDVRTIGNRSHHLGNCLYLFRHSADLVGFEKGTRLSKMVGELQGNIRIPNPSIRGVGAPMDGLSALPWTARWCQGTLPCPLAPNPSIRGVGAPMDGLSASPWTARWCQGTLPCV